MLLDYSRISCKDYHGRKFLNKPQVDLPSADNFYSCITSRFQKVQFKPDALGNSYSYDRVFTFVVPQ